MLFQNYLIALIVIPLQKNLKKKFKELYKNAKKEDYEEVFEQFKSEAVLLYSRRYTMKYKGNDKAEKNTGIVRIFVHIVDRSESGGLAVRRMSVILFPLSYCSIGDLKIFAEFFTVHSCTFAEFNK